MIFLKSDFLINQKKLFDLLQRKSFKMMKNAFYFIFKALFVLNIFKFLSRPFGHVKKTA